jgi:hypothetical protein
MTKWLRGGMIAFVLAAVGFALSAPTRARAEVPDHLRGKWVEVGHPANYINFESAEFKGDENWEGEWKGHFHFGGHEHGRFHYHKQNANDGFLKLRKADGAEIAAGEIHHDGKSWHMKFEGHEYRRE